MISATSQYTPNDALAAKLRAAISRGVNTGAQMVAQSARATVPVDTGELRDSIRVQDSEPDEKPVALVIAGTDHAFFVEYGTGRRGAASAGAGEFAYSMNWPGMAAQPYMRPALDSRREDVFTSIRQEMQSVVS